MQRKLKKNIIRKYQDFYTVEDLRDPDTVKPINLTIDDFNAQGHIVNPRAPCVVSTIDPHYIFDARQQRLAKKFRMKTDILQLREITRKKFMIYATQQRNLEKQREAAEQEQVYKRIIEFYDFAAESLNKMELQAFNEMQQAYEELKKLKEIQLDAELKLVMAEQQSVLIEVQEVYRRFLFLLKLIGYFDDIIEENAEQGGNQNCTEITEINVTTEDSISKQDIEKIQDYMQKTIRPYLSKRNHLNAEIWIKGFEKTRHKIFNYNRRFTQVALLNHIVTIIYEKFQKTYAIKPAPPVLKDPNFMRDRVASLKQRATKIFSAYERKHKQDKLNLKLNGIMSVMLNNVEQAIAENNEIDAESVSDDNQTETEAQITSKSRAVSASSVYKDEQEGTLLKVEKIQTHLLGILKEFDAMPPDLCKTVEKSVRRRVYMEKEMSRRALTKQNRLKNWMEHFKKHELQKPK